MPNLSIEEAQKLVDVWINQFEEGYWPPLSMLAALVEETGELAREINSLEGDKPKRPEENHNNIKMELGDLLFALICIANFYHVNLDQSLKNVLDKYDKRDVERWTLKTGKN